MPLNLQLQALTLPEGTQFPGSPQGLQDQTAQYQEIIGGENFSGVNYGSLEPAPEDRDKAWFKTDESENPVGWFAWDGSAWTAFPVIIPSGSTASRPASPDTGQIYYDTDIDVEIIWNGASWMTTSGSPGDVKFVTASTLSNALTKNPGWSHYTDGTNRVLGCASDGTGAGDHAYDEDAGAEEHTLTITNLPSDAVSLKSGWGIFPGQFQNGSQGAGIFPITTGLGAGNTEETGPINPDTQVPISLLQPTKFLWALVKD